MDFNWSEERFSVLNLVDNVDFPQLLKLSKAPETNSGNASHHRHGNRFLNSQKTELINLTKNEKSPYSESERTQNVDHLLKEGDVLKLHGVRTFKKVIVTGAGALAVPQTSSEQVATEYGYLSPPGNTSIYRQFSLPVSFSVPLSILPFRDTKHVYKTAGDLVEERPRPSAVYVNTLISLPEKNTVIKEGDVLAITSVDKRCTSAGVVDFLICKHNDKTVGLPRSCVGNFTAKPDETLFTLSDLVARHMDIGLPQKICFHSADNCSQVQTLKRKGEHYIVPGAEYIAESIVKQQYLICTKCEENNNSLPHTKVYYIPVNCPAMTQQWKVRLPLFHDMKSYSHALNSKYCPNLSIRDIVDATAIEHVGKQDITVMKLSDVYDITSPQLPPRKDFSSPDSVSMRSAVSFQCLDGEDKVGNYANVTVLPSRNVSDSNLTGVGGTQLNGEMRGQPMVVHSRSSSEQLFLGEDQPLLGEGSVGPPTKHSKRHNVHGDRTPNSQRRGMSTPSTPESRRKKSEAPTWTEKISISLENLKRTFRKGGSEERERNKIGDGSQLADSFENLSVAEGIESMESSSNYENVQLVASQLNKPAGKTKPILKQPPSGIPPSKCSQIKELWTPPCSPDYRDHTTPYSQHSTLHTGYGQCNNSNSNEVNPHSRPSSAFQYNLPQGADSKPPPPHPSTAFNWHHNEPSKLHKSPKATPRQSKEPITSSNGLYVNIGNISPPLARCSIVNETAFNPPSRCSGYSSESRGSSENDLIHYQLETIKSVDMIPEDLTTLSVPGLSDCLFLFELPNVAHKFRQNQIDGQFFMMMSDHMFRDDAFNFSEFELLKLKKLRDGWRPRL